MDRILARRKSYTNETAVQIVRSGSGKEKSELALALGFDCPDYGFAQSICLRLLDSDDENVKTSAIIGLAHIARRFKKLDKRTVKPYLLRELRENASGKELIVDAVEQINTYLNWHIAKHDKSNY